MKVGLNFPLFLKNQNIKVGIKEALNIKNESPNILTRKFFSSFRFAINV